jgi:hypothetical protein
VTGDAMAGRISGIKLFSRPILFINCTNPNAVTWVGIIMIIRINVKIAVFPVKLYACIAYAVITEKYVHNRAVSAEIIKEFFIPDIIGSVP